MLKRGRRLLLLPVALLLMAAVPLELPHPVKLPDYTDSTRVSKALLAALANRKWLVEADTGESITALFSIRSHRLRIRIDYTPQRITFHYVDSENLDYEQYEGEHSIHANANKWLLQLEREVHIQVSRFRFEREPAAVIPVLPAAPVEPAPAGTLPPAQDKSP